MVWYRGILLSSFKSVVLIWEQDSLFSRSRITLLSLPFNKPLLAWKYALFPLKTVFLVSDPLLLVQISCSPFLDLSLAFIFLLCACVTLSHGFSLVVKQAPQTFPSQKSHNVGLTSTLSCRSPRSFSLHGVRSVLVWLLLNWLQQITWQHESHKPVK